VEPKKKSFRGAALPANAVVIYPSAGSSRLDTHPYYHVQYSLHSSYSELMECLETVCATANILCVRSKDWLARIPLRLARLRQSFSRTRLVHTICRKHVVSALVFNALRFICLLSLGYAVQFLPDVLVPTSRRDTASIHKLQVALAELHDTVSSASMLTPVSDACPDAAALSTERPAGRMPATLFEHALTRAEHHRVIRRIARAGASLVSCKCLL
jgi:hypothetical protein